MTYQKNYLPLSLAPFQHWLVLCHQPLIIPFLDRKSVQSDQQQPTFHPVAHQCQWPPFNQRHWLTNSQQCTLVHRQSFPCNRNPLHNTAPSSIRSHLIRSNWWTYWVMTSHRQWTWSVTAVTSLVAALQCPLHQHLKVVRPADRCRFRAIRCPQWNRPANAMSGPWRANQNSSIHSCLIAPIALEVASWPVRRHAIWWCRQNCRKPFWPKSGLSRIWIRTADWVARSLYSPCTCVKLLRLARQSQQSYHRIWFPHRFGRVLGHVMDQRSAFQAQRRHDMDRCLHRGQELPWLSMIHRLDYRINASLFWITILYCIYIFAQGCIYNFMFIKMCIL